MKELTVQQAIKHPIFPKPVCEKTIHRALKRGLKSRLVGNRRWIAEGDLIEWVTAKSRPTGTTQTVTE